jgi:hypothetical protein
MKPNVLLILISVLVAAMAWSLPARSASHQWRFNELFTNADGTIQFIEMKECCGETAEHALGAKWVLAVDADHKFTFDHNLTGDTAFKHLLLATQGFADLPGAPAPDFIIPDNFLPIGGDDLEYWMYSAANLTYAALPTDGVTSYTAKVGDAVNSPTNYAGVTGSIDLTPVEPVTWGLLKALGLWW